MPINLYKNGLFEDFIGDKTLHGGETKALHHFPREHYLNLSRKFPLLKHLLSPGSIGENISSVGVTEGDLHLGDVFRVGSARVQLSEPRKPCWKIDARYQQQGVATFMFTNGITGWYYRILEEGEISPKDELKLEHREKKNPTLLEFQTIIASQRPEPAILEAYACIDSLSKNISEKLVERARWLTKNTVKENGTLI